MAAALAAAATITTITVVAAGVAQVGAQVRERGRAAVAAARATDVNHADDQEGSHATLPPVRIGPHHHHVRCLSARLLRRLRRALDQSRHRTTPG